MRDAQLTPRFTLRPAVAALWILALPQGLWACANGPPAGATAEVAKASPVASLDVRPAQVAGDAKLEKKLKKNAHNYFRFIAQPFSQAVCERYPELVNGPAVNLHGDAHLEQFAVTDLGYGLTDFDEATSGPAVIDLLRFGVSLQLVAESMGQPALGEALNARFLAGYTQGLKSPSLPKVEPALVTAMKAGFKHDPKGRLAWIAGLMKPLSSADQAALEAAFQPYVASMRAAQPGLAADYFKIKALGSLKMGIGSALAEKYLLRVEGPSPAPLDDVIIEAKAVHSLKGVSCLVLGTTRADPFRVLLGEARIAYQPFKLLGALWLKGQPFWVHAWGEEYRELDLDGLKGQEPALMALVEDIGRQLGRGHLNQIAAPLDGLLRRRQLDLLHRQALKLEQARRDLSEEVKQAYGRFVQAR